MPKINSNSYGGIWVGAALLIGAVIPALIRLIFRVWPIFLSLLGCAILLAFLVLFAIEMRQDNGKRPFYQQHLREDIPFDPETEEAVIRCSICTGEKAAGFRRKEDGHFTEVMLIRSSSDEKRFREIYGLDEIKTIY